MALTLTQQFRGDVGKRQLRIYQITHDETTSSLAAASIDLTFMETVIRTNSYYASTTADLSTDALYDICSINATGDTLELGLPMKVGSKSQILVIGW